MEIRLLLKALGFILLLVVGIPGNVFILLRYTHIKLVEKKLLPSSVIKMVLATSNILVIFSRVIPEALDALGVESVLDDTECKLILFTFRVSRAMSICITSYLSCHQCVLIAPVTRYWTYLKEKLNQNVSIIIILILAMNMSLSPTALLYGKARTNTTTSPYVLRLVYCNADFMTYISFLINGLIPAIREIIFVGLMIVSSSYMVLNLHQHGKFMKGKRSSDKNQTKTIEYTASRAVILLVVLYVFLYGMDNSMWIYTLRLYKVSTELNETRVFLAASYSAMSSIVIIATNPKLHSTLKSPWKKKLVEVDTSLLNMSFVSSVSENIIP